jgi:hypothetical protein
MPNFRARTHSAREGESEPKMFHGRFLRLDNFLLQNCAIQRNATRISLRRASSEKNSAQHRENLRKNSLCNYKSAFEASAKAASENAPIRAGYLQSN